MADYKISQLSEDTSPSTDDFTASVDNASGSTKKMKWSQLPKLLLKAITPQLVSDPETTVTGTTITPVITSRAYTVTALNAGTNIAAPTGGTPADMQGLTIRIKDNGTARAITWDSIYRGIGVTLPSTTVAGKMLYVSCAYNSAASKWDALSVNRE